jgi:hypothetical protein
MLPDAVISALAQAPFVVVMAYLMQRFLTTIENHDKEWLAFGEQMHETLAELTERVKELSDLIIRHDERVSRYHRNQD